MSGYPAHDGGVFIVDLALNEAMAEGTVIFGRRDCEFQVGWRIEAGMRKIEFGEDLTLAELAQGLAGKLFQRMTQQDEADVTVFGTRTGRGGERDLATSRIITGEFGQQVDYALVKIALTSVMQGHAGSGGRDDLGDRGEIV